MISDQDRLLKIDECELLMAETFMIYRSTWQLIIKALTWSMEKDIEEIEKRIIICEGKRDNGIQILKNSWQLVIQTLKWVLEDTFTDPIESRKELIPFA